MLISQLVEGAKIRGRWRHHHLNSGMALQPRDRRLILGQIQPRHSRHLHPTSPDAVLPDGKTAQELLTHRLLRWSIREKHSKACARLCASQQSLATDEGGSQTKEHPQAPRWGVGEGHRNQFRPMEKT